MTGTVVTVQGECLYQENGKSQWNHLKRGDNLNENTVVKTGEDGFARILTPSGDLINIPKSSRITLQFDKTGASVSDGSSGMEVGEFVSEFFAAHSRQRINAVRSLTDPLQIDWVGIARRKRFSPVDLVAGFELAAAYQKQDKWNRSIYILWKLSRFMPDNSGLAALSEKAVKSFTPEGEWTVMGYENHKPKLVFEKGMLTGLDQLDIHFTTKSEAFVYLFTTRKLEGTKTETTRIFPATRYPNDIKNDQTFVSRVTADSSKPVLASIRPISQNRVIHVWGIHAAGPVPDEILNDVAQYIENYVRNQDRLPDLSRVKGILPGICGDALFVSLR